MTKNEGDLDRIVRAVAGVALLSAAFMLGVGTAVQVVLGVVGAVLLVTAAAGFCPLYALFGVRTCPAPKRDA